MVRRLSEKEMRKEIKKMKGWEVGKDEFSKFIVLKRKFIFKNFLQAIKFINRVAKTAEKFEHHPDIHLIRWNKVVINIYTHSKGGITEWDFELARLVNKIEI